MEGVSGDLFGGLDLDDVQCETSQLMFLHRRVRLSSGAPKPWQVAQAYRPIFQRAPVSRIVGQGQFIRGVKPIEFEHLIVQASNNAACLEAVYFDFKDSFFRELTAMAGETLNTFPVEGYLEYLEPRAGEVKTVLIKGAGVLRRDLKPTCANPTK